jgi:hypothetical protein
VILALDEDRGENRRRVAQLDVAQVVPHGSLPRQVPHPHRAVVASGDGHRAVVEFGAVTASTIGVAGERVADRGAGR